MAELFRVHGLAGERTLSGTVPTNGAKNAALKLFAAALLFEDKLVISRVPEIEDVKRMEELLLGLGVSVEHPSHGTYGVISDAGVSTELPREISEKFRSSIVVAGPLLARTGRALFYFPGGCSIGKRPIDFFIEGFEAMGATVTISELGDGESKSSSYLIEAPSGKLRGAEIFLRAPSVTATETFAMAGVLAEGETVIKNAAMEPEIISLLQFLRSCGADITGEGTPTIHVRGGKMLRSHGVPYVTIPDRIEAGSYIILAALAGKDVTVSDCEPKHLEALLALLKYAGVNFEIGPDFVRVREPSGPYRAFSIKTQTYPGFPTDLQALMTVFLTQAQGSGSVFETIFESRLAYTESLKAMGAKLRTTENQVFTEGPRKLHGALLESTDLRAGMAFLIAALVAEGESLISNGYYIDRGYEAIEKRLRGLGAQIERIER